jgi:hypothetical protein
MPSRQRNVGYCAPTAQEEVKIAHWDRWHRSAPCASSRCSRPRFVTSRTRNRRTRAGVSSGAGAARGPIVALARRLAVIMHRIWVDGMFGGSCAEAALIAESVSLTAPSSARLRSNCKVTWVNPSARADVICSRPGICPNCVSSGVATEDAMVCGSAPGSHQALRRRDID